MAAGETPLADLTDEGSRLAAGGARAGVTLRIVGGVAVAMRCPSARRPPFARERSDIDAAARSSNRRAVETLLSDLGYEPDRPFNALNGETRLLFWDAAHDRQLDIFLDRIEMCHSIGFAGRLEVDAETLPLAELLLMKLQVVETNEKDLLDILVLFKDHDATEDDTGINVRYLSELLGADWGLWRTATMVAQRAIRFASDADLEGCDVAVQRLEALVEALHAAPKSRRWKLRARVGERVRWYELPEEAH